MEVIVRDNFLSQTEFKNIHETMLGHYFPWHYNNMKTNDLSSLYNFQFTHLFYDNNRPNSNYYDLLTPLIEKINPASILRIKANLTPITDTIIDYDLHLDYSDIQCKTAIFYINTNNGYTLFADGSKIDSIENRFISFNSNLLHTGSSCSDMKVRCVININYFEKNNV